MNFARLYAERIGGTDFGKSDQIYKFEKIKRAKAEARRTHPQMELLDFGVGEPDKMAPAPVREAMKVATDNPANRGYADNGIMEFRIAACKYMETFFGVKGLNPETEVVHSIGSKSALAILPLCFINPGDVTITTVPGYPILATHTKYLGGRVVSLSLTKENNFFPDIDSLDSTSIRSAKLFYVNYPNNPTGAAPSEDFFDRLISFAERHNILIVHDAAYATLVYGRNPLSILSRPGGKEHCVELHSMSKSYNMTGWRLGFVAGSHHAVKAFADIKDNVDSGQFKAIQIAACAGIADRRLADTIKDHYEKRLHKLVKTLQQVGFDAQMPGGTFYLYVNAPRGAENIRFANAEEASQYLIKNCLISTVPWDDAGAYLRFSVTFESRDEKDDDRILHELLRRLTSVKLYW